jgi:hypothetical protein
MWLAFGNPLLKSPDPVSQAFSKLRKLSVTEQQQRNTENHE